MKLAATIAILLPLVQTSEAIYLACCQTTKECPQYYNTIETFVKGKDTYSACCYPDENARTEDLPECVHPIMTEDGVSISVMALPTAKLEGTNETVPQIMEVEDITITEGNKQISIAVTSLEEATVTESKEQVTIEHTSLETSTTEEEVSTTEAIQTIEATTTDETETATYSCCAVTSTTSALRVSKDPVCPKSMHHVEGVTLNLSLLKAPKTLVCCDSELEAGDIDAASVNLCSAVTSVEGSGDVVTDEEEKEDSEVSNEDNNEPNAINSEDGSNSADGFGSAVLSIAAVCAVVQALL